MAASTPLMTAGLDSLSAVELRKELSRCAAGFACVQLPCSACYAASCICIAECLSDPFTELPCVAVPLALICRLQLCLTIPPLMILWATWRHECVPRPRRQQHQRQQPMLWTATRHLIQTQIAAVVAGRKRPAMAQRQLHLSSGSRQYAAPALTANRSNQTRSWCLLHCLARCWLSISGRHG